MDGVLRSWAVPKGPSYDTNDKRLAVKVEDHPLEYGDFEGIIPEGNYGAGGVIVWDRGEWIPLEDWREGLAKGKLLFELQRLQAPWQMDAREDQEEREDWLLIKERDSFVKSPGDQFIETSVLSGLTVDEVKAGKRPTPTLHAAVEEPARRTIESTPKRRTSCSPSRRERVHARRMDLRAQARRLSPASPASRAASRCSSRATATTTPPSFPRSRARSKRCRSMTASSTAKSSCMDDAGKAELRATAAARPLTSPIDIKRAAVELPATFFVFDFIAFEDFDLRPLPLIDGKSLLLQALPKLGAVRALDHIEREGEAFMRQVVALGLEGIIAKRADAPYRGGRSDCWLKIKAERTGDFVIVGFTEPKGSAQPPRRLAARGHGQWHARVRGTRGHGLQRGAARRAQGAARSDRSPRPAVRPVRLGAGADAKFPRPRRPPGSIRVYVCEVRFREWTPDGVLRHAAFLRMRHDKRPQDCVRQGWSIARSRVAGCMPPTPRVVQEAHPRPPPAPPRAAGREEHSLLESQEDLLARRQVHQGRSDRLLSRDLAVDAAVSAQASARDDAVPGRHRRQVVLSEGRARVRARMDAHGADLERGHAARHQVLRLRRRRVPAVRRQPRLDPHAHLE